MIFKSFVLVAKIKLLLTLHWGKSYTTSSLLIPQDGNVARAGGCSGAM